MSLKSSIWHCPLMMSVLVVCLVVQWYSVWALPSESRPRESLKIKQIAGIHQFAEDKFTKTRNNEHRKAVDAKSLADLINKETQNGEAKSNNIIKDIQSNPWTEHSLNEKRTTFRKEEIDKFDVDDINLEKLLESMTVGHNGVDFRPTGLKPIETPRTFERYSGASSLRQKRNFIPKYDKFFRYWPNGTIPYIIDTSKFSNIELLESRWNESVKHIEQETCIRFIRLSYDDVMALVAQGIYHYVVVTNNGPGSGCYSAVGRFTVYATQRGLAGQILNLDESYWFCLTTDAIIHEIGHVIGMMHEFMRPDRDEHLTVNFENIELAAQPQFRLLENLKLRIPFDYYSTMMYGTLAASSTGYPVLEARDPDLEFLISSGGYLSYYDKLNIHKSYKCADPCPDCICENGGYKDHTCSCTCPDGMTGNSCNEVVNKELCGGIIDVRANRETIVQSDFSSLPQGGAKCYWLLKAPEGYAITIEMEEFNILWDNYTSRCYHWLEISYNLIGQPGPKYCGDSFSRGKISTSKYGEPNLMMLKLDTTSVEGLPQIGRFKLAAQAYQVYGVRSEGCGRPPTVENTSNNYGDVGSKNGAIVKYQCIDDYTMFGDFPAITCQADGTWSRVRFSCTLESFAVTCNFDNDDCGIIPIPVNQNSWKRIILDGNGFLRVEPDINISPFTVEAPFIVPARLEPWTNYCLSLSLRRPLGNSAGCALLSIRGIDPDTLTETYLIGNYYYICMEKEWTVYRKTLSLSHPFFLKFYAVARSNGTPFNVDVDDITVRKGRC